MHRNKKFEHHQFYFDVSETNDVDKQITTDAEVTSSADDSQSSELVAESKDQQDFFKRDASIKAPKTGQIIQTPFPPSSEDRKEDLEQLKQLLKQEEAGSLVIEKYSPTQTKINHPLAAITITFNQPMIAVSTMNVENFGISLTPTLKGRWTWTGTKTIQFEPKHRLPYATKCKLQIDKENCVSQLGGKLENQFVFEYSTKQPNVVQFLLRGTISTLKPESSSDGYQISSNELELLNENLIKNFKEHLYKEKETHEKCVIFTFKYDLLKSTQYTIQLLVGCPSAEGPLRTASQWSANFRTCAPLKITAWYANKEHRYRGPVKPGESWLLIFNNLLNRLTINKSLFKFKPELSRFGIQHDEDNHRRIIIYDYSKANTIYSLMIL
ncbi:hypothetical protein I4U23_021756 [Adineta vaga]|nr:hypothetical protein I4U23_021756 [Adineta vaga]